MRFSSTVPSDYLKASDLQGRDVTVTIANWTMEKFNDPQKGEQDKVIIKFQGKEKRLVLNVTNGNTIVGMYGDEMNEWIGKAITLFPTQVDYQGRQVEAIRVRLHPPQLPSDPPPTTREREELNDDIPFA